MKKSILYPIVRAAFLIVFVFLTGLGIQAQTISTVVGSGYPCHNGDGGPATAATLNYPYSVAADNSGNVYIADCLNHCVRKISSTGIISTVAGTGSAGYSGDGGPATAAQLYYPMCVAASNSGRVYIVDNGDSTTGFSDCGKSSIRMINPSGIISTIIGNDTVNGFSGDGGPATAALWYGTFGIAVDRSDNIYFGDGWRVRKITASGIISTVAGNGSMSDYRGDGGPATDASGLGAYDIALDIYGNLYLQDGDGGGYVIIRKVDTSGIINTIACECGSHSVWDDGVPATDARIYSKGGLAVDREGNVYIADVLSQRVRKITTSGIITSAAGTEWGNLYGGDGGAATQANLVYPVSLATDSSNNLYIVDQINGRIRKVSDSGVITCYAGSTLPGYQGEGGPATAAQIYGPRSVRIDQNNNMYVLSWRDNTVRKVSPSGLITTFAGSDSIGYGGDGGPATAALLNNPTAIATDIFGNTYISDAGNFRIRKVNRSGIITTIAGNGTGGFSGDGGHATAAQLNNLAMGGGGIVVDDAGNVYVACYDHIRKISTSGIISTIAGNGHVGYSGDGGPATSAEIWNPTGMVIDRSGNLYIADYSNERIRKISTSGIISTIAGNGTGGHSGDGGAATAAQLQTPFDVAIDSKNNIYIADISEIWVYSMYLGPLNIGDGFDESGWAFYNPNTFSYIRKIDTSGIISTIAGTNFYGFNGDGGSASVAEVNGLSGIALDDSNNIYFADYQNNRIRKITVCTANVAPIVGPSSVCPGSSISLSDSDSYSGTWTSGATSIATVFSTGTVTGTMSGIDTISYTITNLCGNATSKHVITVMPLPSSGTIIGATTLCTGSVTTLTESGSSASGRWSSVSPGVASINTAGILSSISMGSDTIKYTVADSCGIAVSTHIITVNPLPDAGTITGPSFACTNAHMTLIDTTTGGLWSSSYGSTVVSGGVVTGIHTGRDTIYYSVTNFCGTTITAHAVSVYSLPDSSVITGVNRFCQGDMITLADSVTGGTWSSSDTFAHVTGGVVTGTSGGTAIISYSFTNECGTSSATKEINIQARVTPFVTIHIVHDTTWYPGEIIAFDAEPTYGGPHPAYQWYLNGAAVPGATTNAYWYTVYFEETVFCVVTSDLDCITYPIDTSNSFTIHPINLGVNTVTTDNNLYMFPDPNNGNFTLKGTIAASEGEYEVIDVLGKVISHEPLIVNNGHISQTVNLNSSLADGQYFIRIHSGSDNEVLHFVIKR